MTKFELFPGLLATFLVILASSLTWKQVKAVPSNYVCPPPELLDPCRCFTNEWNADAFEIQCFDGPSEYQLLNISQSFINNVFSLVRSYNNGTLHLSHMSIGNTNMTEFDFHPLLNSTIGDFALVSSKKMSRVYLSDGNGGSVSIKDMVKLDPSLQIKATDVFMSNNNLTNEGLGDILYLFDATSLQELFMGDTRVTGGHFPIDDGSGDIEFLPGFSSFVNLDTIYISHYPHKTPAEGGMTKVSGGQFKRNGGLGTIMFSGNLGLQIGEDAFVINRTSSKTLNLELQHCDFNSTSFPSTINENRPWYTKNRPTIFAAYNNHFETLPEEIFSSYFTDNAANVAMVEGDALICDERLKWIKVRFWELVLKISGLQCANDPGRNVWTTSFIS